MDINSERMKSLLNCGEEVKKREEAIAKLKDIRLRDWQKLDTYASKLLNLLIEAEDILGMFDDFQLWNGQCYPDFETLYNRLETIRMDFTNYIDENPELL